MIHHLRGGKALLFLFVLVLGTVLTLAARPTRDIKSMTYQEVFQALNQKSHQLRLLPIAPTGNPWFGFIVVRPGEERLCEEMNAQPFYRRAGFAVLLHPIGPPTLPSATHAWFPHWEVAGDPEVVEEVLALLQE